MRFFAALFLAICFTWGAQTPAAAATLQGAGSTFTAPLYQRWSETFLGDRPLDRIEYDAVGSGEGLSRLAAGKIDFAGSDVCPVPNASRPKTICLPVTAGAVVPIFNVPGVAVDLRLTPKVLAAIYRGEITHWNDPAIRESNHGIPLPAREIIVVHRADSSGTTFAFTDYLSKVDDTWREKFGASFTLTWPVGQSATGNDGVAGLVEKTPGSIGYVELLYALRHRLGTIAVRNAAGRFVRADLESVAAAAETAAPTSRTDQPADAITNAPGAKAYPIATFSWIVVPEQAGDPAERQLLIDFLTWILDIGQRQAAGLGYVAIPDKVLHVERTVLMQLRGVQL